MSGWVATLALTVTRWPRAAHLVAGRWHHPPASLMILVRARAHLVAGWRHHPPAILVRARAHLVARHWHHPALMVLRHHPTLVRRHTHGGLAHCKRSPDPATSSPASADSLDLPVLPSWTSSIPVLGSVAIERTPVRRADDIKGRAQPCPLAASSSALGGRVAAAATAGRLRSSLVSVVGKDWRWLEVASGERQCG